MASHISTIYFIYFNYLLATVLDHSRKVMRKEEMQICMENANLLSNSYPQCDLLQVNKFLCLVWPCSDKEAHTYFALSWTAYIEPEKVSVKRFLLFTLFLL